ncbi:MAG: hypothetical protein V2J25_04695 [Desulfatiglans sp.]|jgi:tetratricopeptide (TPR) repeat protein|nr:hypothetical protein [Thermodesulfobacteriota bacterium]MEE4352149.1 hypothetical protein [Desulfatiglans sp.]
MRRNVLLALGLSFLILLAPDTTRAQTEEGAEIFVQANQAFKADRFDEAAEGYKRLLHSGYQSGHLYYNLGNAYFKSDRLGRAILNYKRARLLIPRDADLNFNLSQALDRVVDDVPEEKSFVTMTFFWLDSLTLAELFFGFALINVFFWGILFIRLFIRVEWTYYAAFVLLIFWIVSGTSFGLKWYQIATNDRAVILHEEVSVMAGPDANDTILFKLHEGTTIRHERSEDGWSLVRLSKDRRGWVPSDSIEEIQGR